MGGFLNERIEAPLSGDVGVEDFFHVTDAYDVCFSLASLMKRRPNAYRCKLERTEYGIDVVDSHAHREEYHSFDGDDGWTEADALGFGRIELVGGRVDTTTGKIDPHIAELLIQATAAAESAEAAAAGGGAAAAHGGVAAGAVAAADASAAPALSASSTSTTTTTTNSTTTSSSSSSPQPAGAAVNEAEPTAEGHAAAAELAALRAASPPQPPGGAGAADAEPTAEPKPPTAIQVEMALSDKLQLFRDQADALLKHTANTDQYLVDVVRRHSANPAIGGGRGKILTMLR